MIESSIATKEKREEDVSRAKVQRIFPERLIRVYHSRKIKDER